MSLTLVASLVALAVAVVAAVIARQAAKSLKTTAQNGPTQPAGAVTYRLDPGPNDVALAFGAAYLASGKADNIQAAMVAAWAAVPHFYEGRRLYLEEIAPLYFAPQPPRPPAADDEAPANAA